MTLTPYNLTGIENSTDLYQFFVEVNTLTTGWFIYLTLVTIFILAFAIWQHRDKNSALIGASFITTIITILFWSIGLTTAAVLIYPILLLLIVVFIQLFRGN